MSSAAAADRGSSENSNGFGRLRVDFVDIMSAPHPRLSLWQFNVEEHTPDESLRETDLGLDLITIFISGFANVTRCQNVCHRDVENCLGKMHASADPAEKGEIKAYLLRALGFYDLLR